MHKNDTSISRASRGRMGCYNAVASLLYLLLLSVLVTTTTLAAIAGDSSSDDVACSNFMTVVAEKMPWKKTDSDSCETSFSKLYSRLMVLSAQMVEMDATLTVYTTYINPEKECGIIKSPPNVDFVYFDAVAMLKEYGYESSLPVMQSWELGGYTRSSDIMRLMLQHKFGKVYVDTDMHFLDTNKQAYYVPFVGAAVWRDVENAIEITNSAFCLPKPALDRMMKFQQKRIEKGPAEYGYTELGPSMFHKILMNEFFVKLYSQNAPKQRQVSEMVQSINLYHHKFVHMTGAIRKGFPGWVPLITSFRKQAKLGDLKIHAAMEYFKNAGMETAKPLVKQRPASRDKIYQRQIAG